MRPHELPPHDGGGSARATTLGENPGGDQFEPEIDKDRDEALDRALDLALERHELGR